MWLSSSYSKINNQKTQNEEYYICYLKKIPDGFTQNRYGQKLQIGIKYFYKIFNNNYYIYENIHSQSILYRDVNWFQEHFHSKESYRNELIRKILEP